MKRQSMQQEKIFANHISNKGFIAKIFKDLIQLKSKKDQITQLKNGQKNWTFFQRHTNGQQVHEKVLHIVNNQRNANQNQSEL